jgi:integrase/recombinase XerD
VQNYFITLSTFYEFLRYEGVVDENPIIPFRKRFIHYFKTPRPEERRLITLKQMKKLILFPDDIMWKTVFCMYAKTGMRRQELIDLDAEDLNVRERKIYLKKHHPKRSNCILFIDDELYFLLSQWMKKRHNNDWNKHPWLFRGEQGKRIYKDLVYDKTIECAEALGFHDPEGRLDQKFGVHCFRHFFTTMILRSGCPREYVQELRGDIRTEAIDIYHHISVEELKEAYMEYVFKFGIK